MPRYFFHSLEGNETFEDPEGTVLSDLAAARRYALIAARELLADSIRFDRLPPDAIIIADQSGREVLMVLTIDVLPENIRKLLR
jgi:hypothetical protein